MSWKPRGCKAIPPHTIKRWHGFEFNGSPWCPGFIRDAIVTILGKSLRSSNLYDEVGQPFAAFCTQAHIHSLVDLASGSGDAMAILVDEMVRNRCPLPTIYLSDLLPNVTAMAEAIGTRPHLKIITTPVDANHLETLADHQGYSIISAFHHFHQDLARKIFSHCVDKGKALVIIEPFPRRLLSFFPLFLYGTAHLALYPIFSKKQRLLKALCTYIIPIIPMAMLWDGLMSVQRIYTKKDLFALAAPHQGKFHWQYQEVKASLGGTVTIFTGRPK